MKRTLGLVAMFAVLAALTTGCVSSRGFAPGAGERIFDTTLKGAIVGTVVGAGVGVLGEVFGGGGDQYHRGAVVRDGYGHGGSYDGHGGYNSRAEAVNARRYRQMQREEEWRRQEAIRAERYYRRW